MLRCTWRPSSNTHTHIYINVEWPWPHRCCLLGFSEQNDYHTSVSTCHRAQPVSAMSPSHVQMLTLTDSIAGCFMLIQIVGGCLCVVHPFIVLLWSVNSRSLSAWHNHNSPTTRNSGIVFSPSQRAATPTRGRCYPSSASPRGSVFLEWRAWLSTAATSEWSQPEPH